MEKYINCDSSNSDKACMAIPMLDKAYFRMNNISMMTQIILFCKKQ